MLKIPNILGRGQYSVILKFSESIDIKIFAKNSREAAAARDYDGDETMSGLVRGKKVKVTQKVE